MKNLKMKSARVAKDLSQQQLADLIGVSRQTISAIEKGDYNPTIRLCVLPRKRLRLAALHRHQKSLPLESLHGNRRTGSYTCGATFVGSRRTLS